MQNHKKIISMLIVVLVLLTAVLIGVMYYKKNQLRELTYEQKVEIVRKLNEDAKNAPTVSTEEKASISKSLTSDSAPMTETEREALLRDALQK